MTKDQKDWFDLGYEEQTFYKQHPEAILQEAWIISIEDIDNGLASWQEVFNNFPYYKSGVLKATKDLKLEH